MYNVDINKTIRIMAGTANNEPHIRIEQDGKEPISMWLTEGTLSELIIMLKKVNAELEK